MIWKKAKVMSRKSMFDMNFTSTNDLAFQTIRGEGTVSVRYTYKYDIR